MTSPSSVMRFARRRPGSPRSMCMSTCPATHLLRCQYLYFCTRKSKQTEYQC